MRFFITSVAQGFFPCHCVVSWFKTFSGILQGNHEVSSHAGLAKFCVRKLWPLNSSLVLALQPSEAGKSAIYWIGHGTNDSMLPLQMSAVSEGVLQSKGNFVWQRAFLTRVQLLWVFLLLNYSLTLLPGIMVNIASLLWFRTRFVLLALK